MTTENEHRERERTGQQHVCVKCGHDNINRNNGRCCEFIVPRNSRESRRCGCKCEFVPVLVDTEQVREIVDEFNGLLTSSSLIDVEVSYDHLKNRIAAALSSRDAEIREVLEGLATKDYHSFGVFCWCQHPGTATHPEGDKHGKSCLAARALWSKLQPKESNDVTE